MMPVDFVHWPGNANLPNVLKLREAQTASAHSESVPGVTAAHSGCQCRSGSFGGWGGGGGGGPTYRLNTTPENNGPVH
jgi:hypothetical protein